MKILYFSDIHIDISKIKFDLPDETYFQYDLIVIAGDLSNDPKLSLTFLENLQSKTSKPIIVVPGNHDRWHNSFEKSEQILGKFPGFLNRKIFEINGERILGLTLWYYFDKSFHRNSWSDLMYIQDYRKVEEEHYLDKEFLINNLKEGDIVVSHMLPLQELVSIKYKNDPYNKYFVTDIPDIIEERKPKLWIHGHSHEPCYTKVYNTLFLRNPAGYPGEWCHKNFLYQIVDTKTLEVTDVL